MFSEVNWEFSTWKEVTILLFGTGGGFGLAALGMWWNRKDRRDDKRADDDIKTDDARVRLRELDLRAFQILMDEQKEFYDTRFKAQAEMIEHMKKQIIILEYQITGLRLLANEQPFPTWMVDMEGKYLDCNSAFERNFLQPINMTKEDIIGKVHQDFWSHEVSSALGELDKIARESSEQHAYTERFQFDSHVPGKWLVAKFPFVVNRSVLAYGGLAINSRQGHKLGIRVVQ